MAHAIVCDEIFSFQPNWIFDVMQKLPGLVSREFFWCAILKDVFGIFCNRFFFTEIHIGWSNLRIFPMEILCTKRHAHASQMARLLKNTQKQSKIVKNCFKNYCFFFLAESSKTPSKCWNIVEYIRQRPFDSHIH